MHPHDILRASACGSGGFAPTRGEGTGSPGKSEHVTAGRFRARGRVRESAPVAPHLTRRDVDGRRVRRAGGRAGAASRRVLRHEGEGPRGRPARRLARGADAGPPAARVVLAPRHSGVQPRPRCREGGRAGKLCAAARTQQATGHPRRRGGSRFTGVGAALARRVATAAGRVLDAALVDYMARGRKKTCDVSLKELLRLVSVAS